jgi:hypothetical protein
MKQAVRGLADEANNSFVRGCGAKQTAMHKQAPPDGQNVVGRLDATV